MFIVIQSVSNKAHSPENEHIVASVTLCESEIRSVRVRRKDRDIILLITHLVEIVFFHHSRRYAALVMYQSELAFNEKPLEPDVIFVTIGNDQSTAAVYGEPHLLGDTEEGLVLRRAREDQEELSDLAALGDLDLKLEPGCLRSIKELVFFNLTFDGLPHHNFPVYDAASLIARPGAI